MTPDVTALEKEIVQAEPEVISVTESPEFDQALVTELGKAVDAYKQIVTLSIRLTTPHDWSNIGGKPYLQCSGAEKIASPFKVSMAAPTRERLEREDSKGKSYIWLYQAAFTSTRLGRTIVAQGKCSSRDQFFGRDHDGYKPMEDIDEENILQAAYTNCFVNGITRLLGIRGLTWDQLAHGGIPQDQVGKVEYRKGGAGGGQTMSASSEFATAPQIKLILLRLANVGLDPAKDLLPRLETLGMTRDINKIPKGRVDEVLTWISQQADRKAAQT